MRGFEALWLPGVDHAGIATQVVVEKQLMKATQQNRHDIGREAFIKKVFEWKEKSGGRIFNQMKRLGVSVDWDRAVFTMDEKCSAAVKEAFIRMVNSGKIFRSTRIINWDCVLNTAVSNIEIDYIELEKRKRMEMPGYDKPVLFGAIWEFAYKVVGSDEEIVIATTRPETMLGDTAIAVHPKDPKNSHFIGKKVKHPFCDRELPIIGDDVLVQIGFGTGAVKITPSHDPNDYECGKRHNLDFINILNDDGTINENGGEFAGMHRWAVREKLIIRLKELKLFKEVKDHKMSLGVCSRSKDVLEPLIKPQWFIDCREMAAKATEAVKSGELEIFPKMFEINWYRWMENTTDWCISRQLWWGHRVPAYLCTVKGQAEPDPLEPTNWIAAHDEKEAKEVAAKKFGVAVEDIIKVEQDPDVLDTWFSSALFPFASLGWPNDTPDLADFFPGSVLETGWDILFFWVAKMVFMSQELTGKLPFKHVFLHAMVRDAEGAKMSKQVGNVIDPIDVIEGATLEHLHEGLRNGNLDAKKVDDGIKLQKKVYGPTKGIPECGTDAMRFGLCNYTAQGRNINLNIRTVLSYRHFCDKLWNIIRFAALSIPEGFVPEENLMVEATEGIDKWILSTLAQHVKDVNTNIPLYNFSAATDSVIHWWRSCLADVYLEAIKPRTKGDDAESKNRAAHVLHTCLDVGLKVLHPFMPFVTEELWQRLARRKGDPLSIMICSYPTEETTKSWKNQALEDEFSWVLEVCQRTRAAKSSYNITRKQDPEIIYAMATEEKKATIGRWTSVICPLVYAGKVQVELSGATDTKGCALQIVDDSCQILVRLAGLGLDYAAELQKLRSGKRKKTREAEAIKAAKQLPTYAKKPQDVRDKDDALLESLQKELEMTEKGLADFVRLMEEEGKEIPAEVVTPEVVKKKKEKKENPKQAAKAAKKAAKKAAEAAGKKEEEKK
jgi:valyl-tRNA synthetase